MRQSAAATAVRSPSISLRFLINWFLTGTYGNRCTAAANGTSVQYTGQCGQSPVPSTAPSTPPSTAPAPSSSGRCNSDRVCYASFHFLYYLIISRTALLVFASERRDNAGAWATASIRPMSASTSTTPFVAVMEKRTETIAMLSERV